MGSIDAWEIGNSNTAGKYFIFTDKTPQNPPTFTGNDIYNKLYPGEWYITVRPIRNLGAKSSMICKQCNIELAITNIPKVSNAGLGGNASNPNPSTPPTWSSATSTSCPTSTGALQSANPSTVSSSNSAGFHYTSVG